VVARSVETKESDVLPEEAGEPEPDTDADLAADVESPDVAGDATIDGSGTTPTATETPGEGEA
jgi:hypothetical protein